MSDTTVKAPVSLESVISFLSPNTLHQIRDSFEEAIGDYETDLPETAAEFRTAFAITESAIIDGPRWDDAQITAEDFAVAVSNLRGLTDQEFKQAALNLSNKLNHDQAQALFRFAVLVTKLV
ncbi:MAG: hypothetical protein V4720_06300 [Pseudomonadota bacterium]